MKKQTFTCESVHTTTRLYVSECDEQRKMNKPVNYKQVYSIFDTKMTLLVAVGYHKT